MLSRLFTGSMIVTLLACAPLANAANGTWTNKTGGVWSTPANWSSANIADGVDATADFSTLGSGISTLSVTLDSARTIGTNKFDAVTNFYLLGASQLTLQTSVGTPALNVANQTAIIGLPLAGNNGVRFTGAGTVLVTNVNTYSGGTFDSVGTFTFNHQGVFGADTIFIGGVVGEAQKFFTAESTATAGTVPIVVTNNIEVRTVRCIIGSGGSAGLNTQPQIWTGNVLLNAGGASARDFFCQRPLTIGGVVSGGNGYGINLVSGSLTLTNPNNTFVSGVKFTGGSPLGVNADGALGNIANQIIFTSAGTLRVDAPFTIPFTRGFGLPGLVLNNNGTIDCQTNDLQIDTVISGNAALIKNGVGKLTLTGAETFTGGLTINAGTLAVTGSGSLAISTAINIPTNATLLLADSATIANASAFNVNRGGSFNVSGLSIPFTLGSAQTILGGGGVTGNVVASSGSLLVPGTIGTAATLSFSNDLTLSGQSIQFDLTTNLFEGSYTNDEIVVAGALTLSGGEKIYLNYLNGSLAPGTYKLVRYGSKSGGFTLGAAYPNVTLDDTTDPNYLLLQVSATSVANKLFWRGDGSANTWDVGTTANWVTNFANPTTVYGDPSTVVFDDNGSNSPAINLNATVSPGGVLLTNNAKSFTLSGAGKITGSTGIVKTGTNTFVIAQDNDFLGTVSLLGGTLQIGNSGTSGALGSGLVSVGAANTVLAFNRSDATTIPNAIQGGTSTRPNITVNSGTVTFTGADDNSFANLIANGGTAILAKSIPGVRVVGGSLTINGGTVQLGGASNDQIADGVLGTIAGGTFDLGGHSETFSSLTGYGNIVNSGGGGTLTLSAASGLIVTNGALTVSSGTVALSGNPGLSIAGTLNVQGGTVNITGAASVVNGVAGGGTLNVSSGAHSVAGHYVIGNANGAGTATANFTGGTFTSSGSSEFIVGFNKPASVTVSGNPVLDVNFFSYGDNPSTNNLNGGLIKCDRFNPRSGGAANVVTFFNGATIQAKIDHLSSPTFFDAKMTHAYVGAGGAFFDSNGKAIALAQRFEHAPALGGTPDGGFTKLGNGTVRLLATNSFTGGVTNQSGLLQFVSVGGSVADVFVADNATNRVQVTVKGTTFTNQTLRLGDSGSGTQGLEFDLGTLGLPTAPPLRVSGTLANAGNVAVNIIAPVLPPGTVSLVKYGSFSPALFSTWSVAPVPYVGLSLVNNTGNGSIDLVVAPGNFPRWTAAVNSQWDTSTVNWKMSISSTPTNYFETTPPGPPVSFDDTAASHSVDLATTVSPAFITMSNNTPYIFKGSGALSGSGALIKSGSGSLVLSNQSGVNNYSGSTLINGGSLVAALPNVLSPNSDTTLNGATLDIGTNNQAHPNLTLNDSVLLGTGQLTGNAVTFTINCSNSFTLTTPLSGTNTTEQPYLVKSGSGTLSITNANLYQGATFVNDGVLRVTDASGLGWGGFNASRNTVVNSGGAVMLDGSFTSPEYFTIGGTGAGGAGAFIVTNGAVLLTGGNQFALQADSTVTIGNNAALTNNNTISGAFRFTKSGAGLLYAGAAFQSAGLTVNDGTVIAAFGIGQGNANDLSVLVKTGSTFGGGGTVTPGTTIQSGATLAPGALGIGTETFNNLTNNGTIVMEISKAGATANSDRIVVNSNFVHTGTIIVTNIGPDALVSGDSFRLFATNYAVLASATPALPPLSAPLFWTNRLAVDGTIAVASAVSLTPTNITVGVSGGNLNLSWPADHIGWRLLVQTNNLGLGISTNILDWGTVAGSTATNLVVEPINAAKPSEFYRLVYP